MFTWIKKLFRGGKRYDHPQDKKRAYPKASMGFGLEFNPTDELKTLMTKTIVANVAKSNEIPKELKDAVTHLVVNTLVNGGDVSSLTTKLSKLEGITRERAYQIATDQNNQCNRGVDRHRALGCGIKYARWICPMGGRNLYPSHVKAGKEGLIYEIEKGAFIDGQYIQPGELPGCSCVGRNIIPGVEEKPITKEFINNYGAKLRREDERTREVEDGRTETH